VRRGDVGLHDQLIDAEIAVEGVFGQYHHAQDRVEQACRQRCPGPPPPGQHDERDPGHYKGQRGIK